jgi:two-component system cell cycle sensor histidine kinase/response regulator CckA
MVDMSGAGHSAEEHQTATPEGASAVESRLQSREQALARESGPIVHDLNNFLMVVENSAALLVERIEEANRPCAELILRTARAACRLAQQLQHAGSAKPPQPQFCDLNLLLIGELDMVRTVVGDSVQVEFVPDPATLRVYVEPFHLQEALLNLAVNAREAMPSGGVFSIATQLASISEDDAELAPGDYAHIQIRDTGRGMDEEARARAFEPYFTTKESPGSRGLGLAAVRDVLRLSQGAIRLSSAHSVGTSFDLYLPLVPSPRISPDHSGKLVLLLEDSDELRRMLEGFISSQGFHVLAASNAGELLEKVQASPLVPQVIIADVHLHGASGTELVAKLSGANRTLKSIFISGDLPGGDGMPELPADAPFLQKPFSLQTLAGTLEQVMVVSATKSGGAESI